jgi:hypothetical protein
MSIAGTYTSLCRSVKRLFSKMSCHVIEYTAYTTSCFLCSVRNCRLLVDNAYTLVKVTIQFGDYGQTQITEYSLSSWYNFVNAVLGQNIRLQLDLIRFLIHSLLIFFEVVPNSLRNRIICQHLPSSYGHAFARQHG